MAQCSHNMSEDTISVYKDLHSDANNTLDVLTVIVQSVQRTLVITTVFVTKGFAVKSNLLLERNLTGTRLRHE